MARSTFATVRWLGVVGLGVSFVWACSSGDTNPFADVSRGGMGTSGGASSGGTSTGGASTGGANTGGASGVSVGGTTMGGASGSNSGGATTGGVATGGTMGDGGAAEGGTNSGGTAPGGMGGTPVGGAATGGASGTAGAGMGGNAGVGMGGKAGSPTTGGAGVGGAGLGGAGAGGAGSGGSAGAGGHACKANGDCMDTEYCKKTTCNAADGRCAPRGPECRGTDAVFAPLCGCDGITYWNRCVIEHEGFNVASDGECTGNNRPTCTRDGGPASCPTRIHAHCYRPVDQCGDPSPTMGVCWAMPQECPPNEAQTQRYCGGTAGAARCIGLCEVIDAENSFRRDAAQCAATTN